MKYISCFLVLCTVVVTSVFAELPDDKDLLLWIGEGNGNKVIDNTSNGNDGAFHGTAGWVADEGKFASGIVLNWVRSCQQTPRI